MTDPDPAPRSWWHTLPGALTAVAALVTAVTGLVVSLNQVGWLGSGGAPVGSSPPVPVSAAAITAVPDVTGGPLTFEPAMREVVLQGVTYTILDAQAEPRTPDTFTLRLLVRATSTTAYPGNFWDNSFRLLVDGVPRAPVGGLNEVVPGHAAAEGEVVFPVPIGATELTLRILHLSEPTDVPLRRVGG